MHERVYDEFVEKATQRAKRRTVGDPFKSGIEQGPQVYSVHLPLRPYHFEKVLRYIQK